MKTKKFVAVLCTLALALALPMGMAFADNPSQEVQSLPTVTGTNSNLTVKGTVAQLYPRDDEKKTCHLIVESADSHPAGNVPSNVTVLNTYRIYYSDLAHSDIVGGGSVSVNLGCAYANYYFTCYVEHEFEHAGTYEVVNGVTDANGNATFNVAQLSYYTFVIGDKVSGSTDSSSTSPVTGVDYTLVAGISCIAIVGAGAAFAARRKLSK